MVDKDIICLQAMQHNTLLFVGATAMRVAGNKEGNGEGGKGNGDSNKGVRQGTALATKWAMVTVTRVAGKEEARVLAATTRWRATKRTMTRVARSMATGMRMAGKQGGQWRWRRQQHG